MTKSVHKCKLIGSCHFVSHLGYPLADKTIIERGRTEGLMDRTKEYLTRVSYSYLCEFAWGLFGGIQAEMKLSLVSFWNEI